MSETKSLTDLWPAWARATVESRIEQAANLYASIWLENSFQFAAQEKGLPVFVAQRKGEIVPTKDEIVRQIGEWGGQRALHHEEDGVLRLIFTMEDGFIMIIDERTTNGLGRIQFNTTSRERFDFIWTVINAWVKEEPAEGALHVLAKNESDGFCFTRADTLLTPLVRENYAPAAVEAFDHAVMDLGLASPCGRIVIVDGPPGCGKTYLVRGIVSAVLKARFIVIPPSLVDSLAEPMLLSTLLGERASHKDKPMVFILEDADACLVPRAADNINAISAILNLSDGILGAALDVRIIATTNAKTVEIDQAIMRPGRLCRRIMLDALEPEHANSVYERLTGRSAITERNLQAFGKPLIGLTPRFQQRAQTLAEVYAMAAKGARKAERS